jgi:hypothetical protein
MKMDFEEFKTVAGGEPKLPASDEAQDAEVEGDREAPLATSPDPKISAEMGPGENSVSLDLPLNDMETQEAIEIARELQGPSVSEQMKEVILDPTVQDILRDVWYGPDGKEGQNKQTRAHAESTTMDPTAKLDTEERTAETDGGTEELTEDNIYEITPEGLVAILQQQVGEVAAIKPDMTLDELSDFMTANEDRLVGEAAELLDAMDME